jgi:hypothetical protein
VDVDIHQFFDGDIDPYEYGHFHRDVDCDPYLDSREYRYACLHRNLDFDGDTVKYLNAVEYADFHQHVDAVLHFDFDVHEYLDADEYEYGYLHQYSDADLDLDEDLYFDLHADFDLDADQYFHCVVYVHRDRNSDQYVGVHCDRDAHQHSERRFVEPSGLSEPC